MSKIDSFNSTNCRLVEEKIVETLKNIENELGVVIQGKGGTFSNNNYTMKLEIATIGNDGEVQTKDAENFKMYAKLYGMEKEDLGKEIYIEGKKVKIIGLMPRSKKYPILGEQTDNGKQFKYGLETVKKALDTHY